MLSLFTHIYAVSWVNWRQPTSRTKWIFILFLFFEIEEGKKRTLNENRTTLHQLNEWTFFLFIFLFCSFPLATELREIEIEVYERNGCLANDCGSHVNISMCFFFSRERENQQKGTKKEMMKRRRRRTKIGKNYIRKKA